MGGAAQRRTASREGVGGWTSEGEDLCLQALKAATLALEMVIIAHAACGFNDGEVMKVFVPSNRHQLRAFEFAKAGICMMIHWWHLRWRKDTDGIIKPILEPIKFKSWSDLTGDHSTNAALTSDDTVHNLAL